MTWELSWVASDFNIWLCWCADKVTNTFINHQIISRLYVMEKCPKSLNLPARQIVPDCPRILDNIFNLVISFLFLKWSIKEESSNLCFIRRCSCQSYLRLLKTLRICILRFGKSYLLINQLDERRSKRICQNLEHFSTRQGEPRIVT